MLHHLVNNLNHLRETENNKIHFVSIQYPWPNASFIEFIKLLITNSGKLKKFSKENFFSIRRGLHFLTRNFSDIAHIVSEKEKNPKIMYTTSFFSFSFTCQVERGVCGLCWQGGLLLQPKQLSFIYYEALTCIFFVFKLADFCGMRSRYPYKWKKLNLFSCVCWGNWGWNWVEFNGNLVFKNW